jgi:biopolymer transport protein ExbB
MDVIAWFRSVGFVAWPLLVASIIAVALMLERSLFWWKITQRQERIVRECLMLYSRSPRAALFKLEQNADLPIARIFLAGLELEQANPEDFRLALETATASEIPLLKRYGTAFDTIVTLSPFLGLLGTVTGLITTLQAARTIGQGIDTELALSGISEALNSTAAGLVIAIGTFLVANIFRSLYVRQLSKIQEYGGQLELLHRHFLDHGFPTSQYSTPPETPYANPGREF